MKGTGENANRNAKSGKFDDWICVVPRKDPMEISGLRVQGRADPKLPTNALWSEQQKLVIAVSSEDLRHMDVDLEVRSMGGQKNSEGLKFTEFSELCTSCS